MEWFNTVLVVWVLLLAWSVVSKKVERESSLGLLAKQLREQLRLFCDGCRFPKATKGLNVHLYFHDHENTAQGRIPVLRKNRTYYFETEDLPDNYHLDFAKLTDKLAICEAFEAKKTIYRLFENHRDEDYEPDLRGKVDIRIKWVLAIPIRLPNESPIGALCCFGHEPLFKRDQEKSHFEVLALRLAEAVANVVGEERALRFYKQPL